MKISLNWLGDFIEWKEADAQAISDRLTLATAETEAVEHQGALLAHTCVGKIVTLSKHPNADKLTLADVETDKGMKRVVCGGTNLKESMLVAFAHIGATVKWHGGDLMTLAPVKIRGEASEGMICAAEELGLEGRFAPKPEHGERPIVDLSDVEGLKVGQGLREAFNLTDTVLLFSNTAITNRPDLFSHLGFARECVALGLATWKKGQPHDPKVTFPKAKPPYTVAIKSPGLVHRYAGCTLQVDAMPSTPDWMKERLAAMGNRSISLPVDITNYVMWELGTPMHAFDANQIQGERLTFRESAKGETVETLDGAVHELPQGAIVLEDAAGIFDLCGLMGGKRSASHDAMTNVYLHVPVYDPLRIRKAVQATGHRTDASGIYEKSVPPVMAMKALKRAVELFLEICPGAKVTSSVIDEGEDGEIRSITLTLDELNSVLGIELTAKEVTNVLESLECSVEIQKGNSLKVDPPLHRVRDLKIPADIVDEVARVYGYERFPETLPNAPMGITPRDPRVHQMRDALKAERYLEILPLSLLSPQLLEKCGMETAHAVRIANPLGEELSLMQTSTLPQLLVHAEKNYLLAEETLKTFHWGHVFTKNKPERTELSMLHVSKAETSLSDDPFLQVKRTLTVALHDMGYEASFTKATSTPVYAHPGRHAAVYAGDVMIGDVFELHPSVRQRFGIEHRAAVAMADLTKLLAVHPKTIVAKPLAQFPAITYDVTLPWTQEKAVGELLKKLQDKSALLESVEVADLYKGKQHQGGDYNLTLRFTYRATDRTLTDDEAKKEHDSLLKSVA